jgi:hypothetical protein
LEIEKAFSDIVETFNTGVDMNPHEFAFKYTNFFTSEAIQMDPIKSMVSGLYSNLNAPVESYDEFYVP